MKYTIFSIDDSRRKYTDEIRKRLARWEEVPTECVNGSDDDQVQHHLDKHGLKVNFLSEYGKPRVGHIGIWLTVINSFEHGEHVTFEDDAILGGSFQLNFELRRRELPADTDFFSLFIPRDSDHLYNNEMSRGRAISKTYQRYGGVSMYYTERGVERIMELLQRDGITGQYDDTLYRYAKEGQLNGYCSKPTVSDLVYITGDEPTIVQESKYYAG